LAVKTLETNHFVASGQSWVRDPYLAQISGTTWVLSVPLNQPTVERLYSAPTSMSTADLAMWYPREKSVVIEHEVFDLTLNYTTSPPMRAEFLMRQLVRLLMGNGQWRSSALPTGWDVDGGQPQPFDVRFDELSTKATLRVHREGADVSLQYTLVTDEAPSDV
jgi:hypothetical protein